MVLLFLIFVIIFGCTEPKKSTTKIINTYPLESLNELLYKELLSKRIIMIGDGYHHHFYYHSNVNNFLNFWLDRLEQNDSDKNIPTKLFLFLELLEGSKEIKDVVNHFFRTGDIYQFIKYQIKTSSFNLLTIDTIEAFYGLKKILERIKYLNEKKFNNSINLIITGANNQPLFNFRNSFGMDKRTFIIEKFKWFAKKRDKLSSEDYINKLKDNPEYKAICYYGSTHLQRGKVRKGNAGGYLEKHIYDYYLPHYLDSYLGREQVVLFSIFPYKFDNTDRIEEFEKNKLLPDYHIRCKHVPPKPFPLEFIKNKKFIDVYTEVINEFNLGTSRADSIFTEAFSYELYTLLFRTYMVQDDRIAKIDSILNADIINFDLFIKEVLELSSSVSNKFDAVVNIINFDKWIHFNYLNNKDSLFFLTTLESVLENLPINENLSLQVHYLLYPESKIESDSLSIKLLHDIKRHEKLLKQYLMINLLWIASPDEKSKAISYLQQSTQLDFDDPKEWSDWWRLKYNSMRKNQ